MEIKNNQLTIDIPEGMEIDLKNSDLAKGIVKFKQSTITCEDIKDALKLCMRFFEENLSKLRLATEEEKQQLFDALAKEGKAWDAEKKQIIDLKSKVELKPFDKVLVRDSKSDYWRATLFSHVNENGCYYCVWAGWTYCIPYEGNEHLLGTNKDVEG